MRILRIIGWDKHYENSRSQKIENARWTPIPNRFDGSRISTLIVTGGDIAYAGWMALVLVASRCSPRGTLVKSTGEPHDAESVSMITRISVKAISATIEIAVKVGLLEYCDPEGNLLPSVAIDCHPLPSKATEGKEGMEGIEGKGKEKKGREGNAARPAGKKPQYTDAFETFWKEYPSHKRGGKKAAFKAWGKVDMDLEDILRALQSYKTSHQWTKNGGRFIPHASTWLNGGYYESPIEGEPDEENRRGHAQAQGGDPGSDHRAQKRARECPESIDIDSLLR